MTKPGGPAQEPQWDNTLTMEQAIEASVVEIWARYGDSDVMPKKDFEADKAIITRNLACVPATPAPSQPAAREAEAFVTKFARERHVKFPDTWDFIYELLDAFLAQKTAAKDVEIAELRAQRSLESRAYAESIDRHNARAEAAERERDSLREANARLAADLDAALKAEKDGQK